ncbi:MAG: putative glycolipid-binding domain-containing protein [Ilumatobacter sp.]|uniref:putative glycolipid-binding domain-containing protein n=1 Tax=Ilumatobacter sp. TaxID=1967498 RepID=UPI00329A6070
MTTAMTAFPADGYTVRWQTWDGDGDETVTLRWENEGWTALGEVGREAVSYVLRLSPLWQVRQFLLFRDSDEPDLWLGNDGSGRWGEMNGAHRPDLDGCTDIDLHITPFTNSLPIRRLQLDHGDAAEIIVALVDVETLGVTPAKQRYEHVAPGAWRKTHVKTATSIDFRIDDFGLVQDEPDLFRRV